MTSIIRKENIICTDSLIFNGGPHGISLEYTSKFKRNTLGTCLILYSGVNYLGPINKILDHISNIIYNLELNNTPILLENFEESFTNFLRDNRENTEFNICFFTKKNSYILKTFLDDIKLFTYSFNELVYIGSGSDYLNIIDTQNKSPLDLIVNVINYVPSCNGPINLFDLNNLREFCL